MNKEQLTDLLTDLAKKDIAEDTDILDHPCMVANRAISQCFEDVDYLKRLISGSANKKSKKAQFMLNLNYDPNW